jgi:hypothetical protein
VHGHIPFSDGDLVSNRPVHRGSGEGRRQSISVVP